MEGIYESILRLTLRMELEHRDSAPIDFPFQSMMYDWETQCRERAR